MKPLLNLLVLISIFLTVSEIHRSSAKLVNQIAIEFVESLVASYSYIAIDATYNITYYTGTSLHAATHIVTNTCIHMLIGIVLH